MYMYVYILIDDWILAVAKSISQIRISFSRSHIHWSLPRKYLATTVWQTNEKKERNITLCPVALLRSVSRDNFTLPTFSLFLLLFTLRFRFPLFSIRVPFFLLGLILENTDLKQENDLTFQIEDPIKYNSRVSDFGRNLFLSARNYEAFLCMIVYLCGCFIFVSSYKRVCIHVWVYVYRYDNISVVCIHIIVNTFSPSCRLLLFIFSFCLSEHVRVV